MQSIAKKIRAELAGSPREEDPLQLKMVQSRTVDPIFDQDDEILENDFIEQVHKRRIIQDLVTPLRIKE